MAKVVWTAEAERWLLKTVGPHRIVYLVRPDDEIHVVGVFDGAMKLENYVD